MTDEEKEVAFERINDQRRDDELLEVLANNGVSRCEVCGRPSVANKKQSHFIGCPND